MEYDAIIIGAGVGGLFSAFKLTCEGKKVLLLEKQPVPGGFATSFTRKGFCFESSVHCVGGLGRNGELREYLEETGLAKDIEFIELNDFSRAIYPGYDFVSHFDRNILMERLQKHFPQEKQNLADFFLRLDRLYAQFDAFYKPGLPGWIKLVISPWFYPEVLRASSSTVDEYIGDQIKDQKAKSILNDFWGFLGLPPSRLSALYFFLAFKSYYYEGTSYIKGGFMNLFKVMVERIKQSGSEVKFNTTVKKIVTNNGKSVKSVVTDNLEEFRAKVVISNANSIDTLTEMLDSEPVKNKYRRKLSGMEKSISAIQVYLALKKPAREFGMSNAMFCLNTTYDHDLSYHYALEGDCDHCGLLITDHAQVDPTLTPKDKGSLLIVALDAFSNWEGLKLEEYKAKKNAVAKKLISRLDNLLPGLAENIEFMEVATPLTMQRYGSAPEGAIYGFAQTVSQSGNNRLSQKTAVEGLYLTGAWTFPGGGVFGCFCSGMEAAEFALRQLK